MIKIEFYENGLLIQGHANAQTKGKDIYCAAVSAISQGAINWFKPDDVEYEIKDGFLRLKIINHLQQNKKLLDLMSIQLSALDSEECKKYIKFNKYEKEI